jgi:hypothetical protein
LPKLRYLDVHDNQLQSLDDQNLKRKFPKLTKIRLSKNLWSCDYFKILETDLKKIKINMGTSTNDKNCIERIATMEFKPNFYSYENHQKEVMAISLPDTITQPIEEAGAAPLFKRFAVHITFTVVTFLVVTVLCAYVFRA